MNPGIKLDRLIAERVMGWVEGSGRHYIDKYGTPVLYSDGFNHDVFTPSENIADAWRVIERLSELGGRICDMYDQGGCWSVAIEPNDSSSLQPCFRAIGNTAPHAICLAALEAVRNEATNV
jgi:hypothetical protein